MIFDCVPNQWYELGFAWIRQWLGIVISTAVAESTARHTVKFTGCLANGKSALNLWYYFFLFTKHIQTRSLVCRTNCAFWSIGGLFGSDIFWSEDEQFEREKMWTNKMCCDEKPTGCWIKEKFREKLEKILHREEMCAPGHVYCALFSHDIVTIFHSSS